MRQTPTIPRAKHELPTSPYQQSRLYYERQDLHPDLQDSIQIAVYLVENLKRRLSSSNQRNISNIVRPEERLAYLQMRQISQSHLQLFSSFEQPKLHKLPLPHLIVTAWLEMGDGYSHTEIDITNTVAYAHHIAAELGQKIDPQELAVVYPHFIKAMRQTGRITLATNGSMMLNRNAVAFVSETGKVNFPLIQNQPNASKLLEEAFQHLHTIGRAMDGNQVYALSRNYHALMMSLSQLRPTYHLKTDKHFSPERLTKYNSQFFNALSVNEQMVEINTALENGARSDSLLRLLNMPQYKKASQKYSLSDLASDSVLYMEKRPGENPRIIFDYKHYKVSDDKKTRQEMFVGMFVDEKPDGQEEVNATQYSRIVFALPYFDREWRCNVTDVITHYPISAQEYEETIERRSSTMIKIEDVK